MLNCCNHGTDPSPGPFPRKVLHFPLKMLHFTLMYNPHANSVFPVQDGPFRSGPYCVAAWASLPRPTTPSRRAIRGFFLEDSLDWPSERTGPCRAPRSCRFRCQHSRSVNWRTRPLPQRINSVLASCNHGNFSALNMRKTQDGSIRKSLKRSTEPHW